MKLDTNGWPMTSDTNRRVMPNEMLWHVTDETFSLTNVGKVSLWNGHSRAGGRIYIGDSGNGELFEDMNKAVEAFDKVIADFVEEGE